MGDRTGKVIGQEIGKFKGLENQRVLSVRLNSGDNQRVLHMSVPGEDSAPVDGDYIIIGPMGSNSEKVSIVIKDQVIPTVDAGEKKVYSYDSSGILAVLYLDKNGKLALGNPNVTLTSTPPGGVVELLEIIDRFFTIFEGAINLPGAASQATLLASVVTEIGKLRTDIAAIKGAL